MAEIFADGFYRGVELAFIVFFGFAMLGQIFRVAKFMLLGGRDDAE